jgi:hypothetical protein
MDSWWLRMIKGIYAWIPSSLEASVLVSYFGGAPVLNFLPGPDVVKQSGKRSE